MATRETWAARVHEWKRSGLTAAAYAEREGFNAGTLTWWSSTLGRATLATSGAPPVIEVMMAARAASVLYPFGEHRCGWRSARRDRGLEHSEGGLPVDVCFEERERAGDFERLAPEGGRELEDALRRP